MCLSTCTIVWLCTIVPVLGTPWVPDTPSYKRFTPKFENAPVNPGTIVPIPEYRYNCTGMTMYRYLGDMVMKFITILRRIRIAVRSVQYVPRASTRVVKIR